MRSTKPQSVQGYLTGVKLLSSKMKTANKNNKPQQLIITPKNANQSLPISSPRRSRQSYKKKDSGNRSEMMNIDSSVQKFNEDESSNSRNIDRQFQDLEYRNNIFSKSNNKSSVHSSHHENDAKSQHSRHRAIPDNIMDHQHQVNQNTQLDDNYQPNSKVHASQIKNNRPSSRNFAVPSSSSIIPMKKNPEITQLHTRELLSKLVTIKHSLQQQIGQLKHILDNTALYLETLDEQYTKIKQKILIFTSKTLDSAFKQYKNSLPNWIKYQNMEHSGINKLAQINAIITEYDTNHEINTGVFMGDSHSSNMNSHQIQRKIEGYKLFAEEVADSRKQCISFRPLLTEQRIKKYEIAVYELGKF